MSGTYMAGLTLQSNRTTIDGTLNNGVYGSPTTDWTIDVDGKVVSTSYKAIVLGAGGYINNFVDSLIEGYAAGTTMFRFGQITNFGTIDETSDYGASVQFYDGGIVVNGLNGQIDGNNGINISGIGCINNSGTIDGQYVGIYITAGSITNSVNGYIAAPVAIDIGTAGTIINSGTIKATSTFQPAVNFGQGINNELIISPGSTIIGVISNFESQDTLDIANTAFSSVAFNSGAITLGNASAVGVTISLGGAFSAGEFHLSSDGHGGTNVILSNALFGGSYNSGIGLTAAVTTISATAKVSGAYAALAAGTSRAWTLQNYGLISQTGSSGYGLDFGLATNSSIQITNAVSATIEGASAVRISGGTLTNYGTIIGTDGVALDIESSTSDVDIKMMSGSVFHGEIVGFEQGDTIDWDSTIYPTSVTFSNNLLVLFLGTKAIGTLSIGGGFESNEFSLTPDHSGGVNITLGTVENVASPTFAGLRLSANYTSIGSSANIAGYGIYGAFGRNWIIANAANVSSSSAGIHFASGTIENETHATVSGILGIALNNGMLSNAGVISGSSIGVLVSESYNASYTTYSVAILNASTGNITGATGMLLQGSSVTFTNAGTVQSSMGMSGVSVKFTGNNSKLIIDPGAVFVGSIVAATSWGHVDQLLDEPTFENTMELLSSTTQGTLWGIGTTISGFNTLQIDPNASWVLQGSSAGLANGQIINGFNNGDELILNGFSASGSSYVTGVGLELWNNTAEVTLDITGTPQNHDFGVASERDSTEIILCYLKGTRILTPIGKVAVENLRIGDTVITKFSGYRRVKWIGTQSYSRQFLNDGKQKLPIRISAGALGPSIPHRDLYVSPGHSILIGGRLVLAAFLVNGISIVQLDSDCDIHYYSIELDEHDCISANGCWSETYADAPGQRAQFHNWRSFAELYPNHSEATELKLCANRPEFGLELEAALRQSVERATVFARIGSLRGGIDTMLDTGYVAGWAQDTNNPELPVLLEVFIDGIRAGSIMACDYRHDLKSIRRGRCMFQFHLDAKMFGALSVRRAFDGKELPRLCNFIEECRQGASVA